jgi:hypothetical protein
MTKRFMAWRGVHPDRIDAASVILDAVTLSASGTSLTSAHTLSYELETTDGWVTDRIRVRVGGGAWWRSLDLRRDAENRWSAVLTGENDKHLGPAGVLDPEGLVGALDCDLQDCPLTNTMPVLRHDLVAAACRGEQQSVDFTMAWISLPDLAVHVSPQTYSSVKAGPGGGAYVDFRSGDFEATLLLDSDGLVVNYPGLGTRIPG